MEKVLKRLHKLRAKVGQGMVSIFIMSIFTRFITNGNPESIITPGQISNILFWTSFILFSIVLMITIRMKDIQLKSREVCSSIYREDKRKRAA